MGEQTEPQVIAVWARVDEFDPEDARIFTGDGYADWAETNHLADIFPNPARFYGLTTDGKLTELVHSHQVGPYDADDYATVTHLWTTVRGICRGTPGDYTTGVAHRDGRA
jgi:hypothetical protein